MRSFSSCLHRLHVGFSDTDQDKLVFLPGHKHNLVHHKIFSGAGIQMALLQHGGIMLEEKFFTLRVRM